LGKQAQSDDAVMEQGSNLQYAVYSNCYLLVKLRATISFLVHQVYSTSMGEIVVKEEQKA
jgi:hypothetical protein